MRYLVSRRRIAVPATALLLGASLAAPLRAHDAWLVPNAFAFPTGATFQVRGTASLAQSNAAEAPAQPGRDSTAVADVVARYHRALANGDSAAALALLAPDAVILESGGMETRAEYRGHHLPADIGFARAVKSVRGAMRVVVQGDAAWATSTSTAQGEYQSRAINSAGAELMVLTRGPDGRWLIRAIHWSSRARRP